MIPRTPRDISIFVISGLTGVILLVAGLSMPWEPFDRHPGKTYSAAPYVAPSGCQGVHLEIDEDIPSKCNNTATRILDSESFGLVHHGRGDAWIRVNNDAINVQCNFIKGCHIWYIAKDKFRR